MKSRYRAVVAVALGIGSWGCASTPGGGRPAFDPTGIYDVTMASQGLVSEGTMTIRGVPGDYRGTLAAGGVTAEIRTVEVGDDNMNVRAETTRGMLVLRLLKDGDFLSGNWVLGDRRGTFTAERRVDPEGTRSETSGATLQPDRSVRCSRQGRMCGPLAPSNA